jgi:uncharacterized membrane protein YvlD (DUF360 family)
MSHIARLIFRALLTWALEAAALYLMLRYVPGVTVVNWQAAAAAILAIGLLNALIRPAILFGAANLGVIPFLLIALPLNAVLVLVAGRIVPGFAVDGLLTAFLLAVGLATANALLSAMLSVNDDDSFYRNVIRRLAGRLAPTEGLDRPGTVIVQIDGLAEPILRRALGEGRMPTLASWLASGSHRLAGWDCDIPSMTTGSQAGILHGDNSDIPAFYWYEKRERRLMSSANPRDLHAVQRRISDGRGLLGHDGASVTNLFSGDAERSIMTVGTLIGDEGRLHADPRDFYGYLLNPYNLYRGLAGMFGETVVECWQALRQKVENVRPRIRRFGLFTLQRGATNVVVRDATTWAVVSSMYRGRHLIYCDYLGYDEVAHYAGPETREAVATLSSIDRQLRQLAHAAREAPRPYHFVVLSDHGQTTAAIFETVYGKGLDAVVRDLIDAHDAVHLAGSKHEGSGYLTAFLNEVVAGSGRTARSARRIIGMRAGEQSFDLPTERQRREHAARAEVVMTSSGSLGHIYFAQVPDQLSLEQITVAYPGLIEALVAHEGIGFVLLRSETRGAIVLGKHGVRELDSGDAVQGEDPLAGFSPHTGGFLRRLAGYTNAGDIIVNGAYDPSTGHIIGIDDLVGAHGGVGGMQTQPFIAYPSGWTEREPEPVGAASVHRFLRRHALGEKTPPDRPTEPATATPGDIAGRVPLI